MPCLSNACTLTAAASSVGPSVEHLAADPPTVCHRCYQPLTGSAVSAIVHRDGDRDRGGGGAKSRKSPFHGNPSASSPSVDVHGAPSSGGGMHPSSTSGDAPSDGAVHTPTSDVGPEPASESDVDRPAPCPMPHKPAWCVMYCALRCSLLIVSSQRSRGLYSSAESHVPCCGLELGHRDFRQPVSVMLCAVTVC